MRPELEVPTSRGLALATEEKTARVSRAAVASFALALLGIIPVLVPSLLAIIFGIAGVRRATRPGYRGRWLAIAGIGLGLAGIAWTVLWILSTVIWVNSGSIPGNNLP